MVAHSRHENVWRDLVKGATSSACSSEAGTELRVSCPGEELTKGQMDPEPQTHSRATQSRQDGDVQAGAVSLSAWECLKP